MQMLTTAGVHAAALSQVGWAVLVEGASPSAVITNGRSKSVLHDGENGTATAVACTPDFGRLAYASTCSRALPLVPSSAVWVWADGGWLPPLDAGRLTSAFGPGESGSYKPVTTVTALTFSADGSTLFCCVAVDGRPLGWVGWRFGEPVEPWFVPEPAVGVVEDPFGGTAVSVSPERRVSTNRRLTRLVRWLADRRLHSSHGELPVCLTVGSARVSEDEWALLAVTRGFHNDGPWGVNALVLPRGPHGVWRADGRPREDRLLPNVGVFENVAAFSPKGNRLVVSDPVDWAVHLFDVTGVWERPPAHVRTFDLRALFQLGDPVSCRQLVWSPDGGVFAAVLAADRGVVMFDSE